MAETIRDVVIRMQIKQVGDKLKPPKLGPVKKQVDEIDKAVVKLDRDTKSLASTNIELFDSFGMVGEGALKLGRGMTLLGISADDDLRKVVEQLAKMQGALDVFTGGIQAVKGMVAAQKALAEATATSTAAQLALNAATSPWLLAIVGVTGVVLTIADSMGVWGDEAQETGRKIEQTIETQITGQERLLQLDRDRLAIRERGRRDIEQFFTDEEKLESAINRRASAQIEAERLLGAQSGLIGLAGSIPARDGKIKTQAVRSSLNVGLKRFGQIDLASSAAIEAEQITRRSEREEIKQRQVSLQERRKSAEAAAKAQAAFNALGPAQRGQVGIGQGPNAAILDPVAANEALRRASGGQTIEQESFALSSFMLSVEKERSSRIEMLKALTEDRNTQDDLNKQTQSILEKVGSQ